MERIVLEVDAAAAKAWRNAPEAMKQRVTTWVSQLFLKDIPQKGYGLPDDAVIRQTEAEVRENHAAYEASLDKLRQTAKANGLAPEILQRLLNE